MLLKHGRAKLLIIGRMIPRRAIVTVEAAAKVFDRSLPRAVRLTAVVHAVKLTLKIESHKLAGPGARKGIIMKLEAEIEKDLDVTSITFESGQASRRLAHELHAKRKTRVRPGEASV